MAKVTFDDEDRSEARENGGVMVSFAVDGRYCEDFPDKQYQVGGVYREERAAGLIELVRDYLRKTKTPAGDATAGGK